MTEAEPARRNLEIPLPEAEDLLARRRSRHGDKAILDEVEVRIRYARRSHPDAATAQLMVEFSQVEFDLLVNDRT
ncbi:hypothetical protein [Acidisphaera sp. L21]|uniref:hypothetical protein n=1 Tax=Acidisphaera sp. L21 TaxID=1641851 RepID=UPI00131CA211|nr:hypothetical protein [Acidisphaera sp. L21]